METVVRNYKFLESEKVPLESPSHAEQLGDLSREVNVNVRPFTPALLKIKDENEDSSFNNL